MITDAEAPAQTDGPPAVRLRGITKRFPGVLANDDVSFDARRGEVHALLGENGAGKSTLSNVITGLYRPDAGTLEIDGVPRLFSSPREAIEAGIGMVHQHFRLVEPFTVAENIVLGDTTGPGKGLYRRRDVIDARVTELAERYGLDVDPRARIWQLSVGEQQRVEILKALYRDARILIMDEPTAVLTPQEAERLTATLKTITAEGRTVIFISHRLREVIGVADRITVLRGGRSVATLSAAGATPRSLASLMVGREVSSERPAPITVASALESADAVAEGEVVLALSGLCASSDRGLEALRDVSLDVHAGEVVAIAGVAGNGQRELAETITGLRRASGGTVSVAGRQLRSGDPRGAIRAGIAHVPEDRMGTGVSPSLPVAENIVLKSYRSHRLSRGPFVAWGKAHTEAQAAVERYEIRTPSTATPARQLSGGNVQKVVLAREFASSPAVIVAASPTRGLDIGAIETVHGLLRDAASKGVGVLLISEDLDEILALADRICVLYHGSIVGEEPGEGTDVERVGLLMAGAGT